MSPIIRKIAVLIPTLGLLGACGIFGSEPKDAPPATTGAVVAPATDMALAGSSALPSGGGSAVRLPASDVLGLLSNNTAIGLTSTGVPYEVYFASDGSAYFREANLLTKGSWRVLPDGRICSRLQAVNAGAENCYLLSRYGDVVLYQAPGGPVAGSIRVVAGNPQKL